ncbi:MAG: prepilin-type N-terminal cleavage/methylation domain-containing protein, partial [Candidatus Eisenbacteria bacterium]
MSTFLHSGSGRPSRRDRGFTLVETMVTLLVMAVVMVVIMSIVYAISRNKAATANRIESSQGARVAIDLMSKDLRSAGYGVDRDSPSQPPIAYVDSVQVLINEDLQPFPDTTSILWVVQPGTPQAYNPAGNPKPFQFAGTAWTPSRKFLTGAETIRWTLDVNNDGVIDANDIAGTDAAKTQNPN